ncbi:hypothetical protein PTKIN_Ptkin11bG0189400 [Pterospermum kingtungense]
MEGELKNLLRLTVLAIASVVYCYFIAAKTPKGLRRLLFLFPIIILLATIPFNLYTFHIGAPAWFYLAWLCNFKLLLFAFDQGPLSSSSSLDVLHFILIGGFPIKIRQNSHKIKNIGEIPSQDKYHLEVPSSISEAINKSTLLALLCYCYNYKQSFHPNVLLTLYFFHCYLLIQLLLAVGAIPAQLILGCELEPQFNAPLVSTSLQDFWGHRWNLRVSDILRATIYDPLRGILKRRIPPQWATYVAVFITFMASGLMHELLYYHITRASPTWEVTWFFVLQGIFVDIEILLKKKLAATNKFRLHRVVSGPLALANIAVTAGWLSYTQLLRNGVDEKIIKEFQSVSKLLKGQ